MGAQITKWLIDSNLEELNKKMPWREDEGDKKQEGGSIFEEISQRADEMLSQEQEDQGAATCQWRRL